MDSLYSKEHDEPLYVDTHIQISYAGHTFKLPRLPTESTELAHRRAWWIIRRWEELPTASLDTIWNQSVTWSRDELFAKAVIASTQ